MDAWSVIYHEQQLPESMIHPGRAFFTLLLNNTELLLNLLLLLILRYLQASDIFSCE